MYIEAVNPICEVVMDINPSNYIGEKLSEKTEVSLGFILWVKTIPGINNYIIFVSLDIVKEVNVN